MNVKSLKRMKKASAPQPQMNESLHERAVNLFGYHQGRTESKGLRNAQTELALVKEACDAIGCRYPFTPESVERYKKVMAPDNDQEWLLEAMVGSAAIGGVLTLVSLVLISVEGWGPVLGTCLLIGVSFLIPWLWAAIYRPAHLFHLGKREWKAGGLAHYPGAIPEFALQTACDMQEYLYGKGVGPSFSIEVLHQRRIPTRDPFLVLHLSNNTYYLEVWDEPGYLQERMV